MERLWLVIVDIDENNIARFFWQLPCISYFTGIFVSSNICHCIFTRIAKRSVLIWLFLFHCLIWIFQFLWYQHSASCIIFQYELVFSFIWNLPHPQKLENNKCQIKIQLWYLIDLLLMICNLLNLLYFFHTVNIADI